MLLYSKYKSNFYKTFLAQVIVYTSLILKILIKDVKYSDRVTLRNAAAAIGAR